MREKQFPPPPWRFHIDWSDSECEDVAGASIGKVCPWGGFVIAEVSSDVPENERAGVALLLHTAPDLLEELEDRLESDRCGCGHPACKRCQRDAETERVIARAYGEDEDQ